jgi:hypothetical protein
MFEMAAPVNSRKSCETRMGNTTPAAHKKPTKIQSGFRGACIYGCMPGRGIKMLARDVK